MRCVLAKIRSVVIKWVSFQWRFHFISFHCILNGFSGCHCVKRGGQMCKRRLLINLPCVLNVTPVNPALSIPKLMFIQDAPLMALHEMLNVAPIIPHCMFRRYLKNILPWPLK